MAVGRGRGRASGPLMPAQGRGRGRWKAEHPRTVWQTESVASPHQRSARKDYSSFPSLDHPPKKGDRLAYRILEVQAGGPSLSAFKEASVESYDTATSIITLRTDAVDFLPLDGSSISEHEDKTRLLQQAAEVLWEHLCDVKLVAG